MPRPLALRSPRVGLALLAALVGCGGATASGGGAGRASNDAAVLLRVRPPSGAHYVTEVRTRTEANGMVLDSSTLGTLEVRALDAATDQVTFASSVTATRVTDPAGAPIAVGDPASIDLTGVVFTMTVDARGATVGEVGVAGATATNAAFAESMRAMAQQMFVHLPEAPVAPGATWTESMDVAVPLEGRALSMHCDLREMLRSVDETGAEPVAVVGIEGACALPPSRFGEENSGMTAELSSTFVGENRIALSDGLARAVTSRTETRMRMTGPDGAVVLDTEMLQHVVSATTRVD